MLTIHKKLVVDDKGVPQEVILPWDEYLQIEEILGLDLSDEAIADLERAAKDRAFGNAQAFVELDTI